MPGGAACAMAGSRCSRAATNWLLCRRRRAAYRQSDRRDPRNIGIDVDVDEFLRRDHRRVPERRAQARRGEFPAPESGAGAMILHVLLDGIVTAHAGHADVERVVLRKDALGARRAQHRGRPAAPLQDPRMPSAAGSLLRVRPTGRPTPSVSSATHFSSRWSSGDSGTAAAARLGIGLVRATVCKGPSGGKGGRQNPPGRANPLASRRKICGNCSTDSMTAAK